MNQEYSSLFDIDEVIAGSETESDVAQFCDISYIYLNTCSTPDEKVVTAYQNLCIPLTTQSLKFQGQEKKQPPKKPMSSKCFIKTD